MTINISHNTHFVFDLDDTLTDELDFVHSGYRHISAILAEYTGKDISAEMITLFARKKNVFESVIQTYGSVVPNLNMEMLLKEYREHIPAIELNEDSRNFLKKLKELSIPCGLITDGRSITQRNKLKALHLESYFSDVIISEEFGSEKPDPSNYYHFEQQYPGRDFYFFGDNTLKDFIIPVKLGWTAVCIRDKGKNIHPQVFEYRTKPHFIINSFDEVSLNRQTQTSANSLVTS